MEELFIRFFEILNETLAAAIVVLAASLLLYNLSRNLRNRIARTSGAVLACVTATYVADVFLSLGPGEEVYEAVLRVQWIGIAFIPAAMFHLSDALLATTGLPSRGRRRRIVRILYLYSAVFLLIAAFTDLIIAPISINSRLSLQDGPLFFLYVLFFISVNGFAFYNVDRARRRCLTRSTRRRMGYLEVALLTAPLGIFPFSALFNPGDEFSLLALVLVNTANLVIVLMLIFLSYPLSFFGSRIPDRVVKAELLRFLLRGPGTGLLVLVTIIFTTQATRILGLSGEDFMPFAVVAVVLMWQWSIALSLPWLEKKLIYPNEDDQQITRLQQLSNRLLTHTDLTQLIEATLAATCDYLRVNTAFVASTLDEEIEIVKSVGPLGSLPELLQEEGSELYMLVAGIPKYEWIVENWHGYRVIPLYSKRSTDGQDPRTLIGLLAIEAQHENHEPEPEEVSMLQTFVRRAAQTLDDLLLQSEIFAALEGLLPQISMTRTRAEEVEYLPGRTRTAAGLPDREEVVEQVRAALRHYWGGPGITHSRLMELNVVQACITPEQSSPVNALRSVLNDAIERQRPEGERKLTSPEWTVYNILRLRFIEKKRVRDVAYRMGRSEADLYRKQRTAIEAAADAILQMEQETLEQANG